MAKKPMSERPCRECNKIIQYVPRRVYCLDCYKLKNPLNEPKVDFIDDD